MATCGVEAFRVPCGRVMSAGERFSSTLVVRPTYFLTTNYQLLTTGFQQLTFSTKSICPWFHSLLREGGGVLQRDTDRGHTWHCKR